MEQQNKDVKSHQSVKNKQKKSINASLYKNQSLGNIKRGLTYLVALDLKLVWHALKTTEASHGLAMLDLNLLFRRNFVVLGLYLLIAALVVVIVCLILLTIDI